MKNLLKRILGVESKIERQIEKSAEELRLYARYSLLEKGIGSIKILDNNQTGQIINISYGGILARFEDPWTEEIGIDDNRSFSAELEVLGQKTPTNVQFINARGPREFSGFSFQHRNVETLVFLREILENFRIGASLRSPPKEMVKEEYRSGKWTCLRGEGPTDYFCQIAEDSPKKALLSFRDGSSYCELKYEDGAFTTGRTVDLDGPSSRIQTSEKGIDPVIFRQGIEILLGAANNSDTKAFSNPILKLAIKHRA